MNRYTPGFHLEENPEENSKLYEVGMHLDPDGLYVRYEDVENIITLGEICMDNEKQLVGAIRDLTRQVRYLRRKLDP